MFTFKDIKKTHSHIFAFLISLAALPRIFSPFPDTCQSIVNEVLAKKPKRRVEWVPFTTRSSCFRPGLCCSRHISSYLIDVWYAFKYASLCFQISASYIFLSTGAISRRVVNTRSQVLVRSVASQHLAATQQHPATIEDPKTKQ